MSLTKRESESGVGTEREDDGSWADLIDLGYEQWSKEFYPEPTQEELIEMAERNGE